MSTAGFGSGLSWRWRNRDRTFERAAGRYVLMTPALGLLVVWLGMSILGSGIHPLVAVIVAAAGVAGIVLLVRWLGRGRILLGFWLALLSLGLGNGILISAYCLYGLLIVGVAPPGGHGGYVIMAILAAVIAVLCWFGLKHAERRL